MSHNFWKVLAKSAAVIAIAAFAVFGNAPTAAADPWGPWLDRDDPTATGDWETTKDHNPCNGRTPAQIQCRVKGTNQMVTEGQTIDGVVYHCNAANGGWCVNPTPGKVQCKDLEVRYKCDNCRDGEWVLPGSAVTPKSDTNYCCEDKGRRDRFCCTPERKPRAETMSVPELPRQRD